LTLVQIDPKPS